MIDIPALVTEAVNNVSMKAEAPTFVEQLCPVCSAAMELAEHGIPTCSQCGLTAAQADALDGTREQPVDQVTNNAGWYLERPGDRELVTYIEIPKTANNHQKKGLGQSNALQPDAGMPKRKPKEVAPTATQAEPGHAEQPQQPQSTPPRKQHKQKG